MPERQVRSERDRRRRGLESLICAIQIQENESEDSVGNGVVRILVQGFSKRLLGIVEATEVAKGKRSFERRVSEVAAHLRPR
jgi:hypothetical protein